MRDLVELSFVNKADGRVVMWAPPDDSVSADFHSARIEGARRAEELMSFIAECGQSSLLQSVVATIAGNGPQFGSVEAGFFAEIARMACKGHSG